MFELSGEAHKIGFTPERGFGAEDLAFYEDLVAKLLHEEVRLISSRLAGLPPEQVAEMVEAVIPIIDRFIVRLHGERIRDFFANML